MICVPVNINTLIISLLIFIGIISGIYHGIFNRDIYHASDKENIHKKIHTIWIHFVSGIIGAVSLFYLYQKFILNWDSKITIALGDIVLLILGILGIVGLLPMTLWFIVLGTNKLEDLALKLIKK